MRFFFFISVLNFKAMKTRFYEIGIGLVLPIVFAVMVCALGISAITHVVPFKIVNTFEPRPETEMDIALDSALTIAVNTIGWNRACPQQVGIYIVDYEADYFGDYPWSVWLDERERNSEGYPMYFKTLEEVKEHIKLCLEYDLIEN
jgi:hypothetical protein